MHIQYIEGDATQPLGSGTKIIVHCCNNLAAWGSGFVIAISRRWERPAREYKRWMQGSPTPMLGAVQLVPVEPDIIVANIIGQNGIGFHSDGTPPIRYEALKAGFDWITQWVQKQPDPSVYSIHGPRLGCSLAGGSWAKVEPLLEQCFVTNGLPVTIYDWPGSDFNP